MQAKPLILSVDDEQDVTRLMERVLGSAGYEVITTNDSGKAMELVSQRNPDLVLLDIKMPGKSGVEILHEIKENHPDTAVIMATAIGDLTVAVDAMKDGAFDYLAKPFNVNLLTITVERALERRKLILENRDYQLNLEKKVAEQTQLLEQKVRELTALNNLFAKYLNQGFEVAETQDRLAGDIIKMTEEIQRLAKEAEVRKVEVPTLPDKEIRD